MAEKTYPILSYSDIQKINWFVADTVRDKGQTEASQYKLIALPFLSLKRFLDLREEFKKDEIYTSIEYEFEDNNLERTLLSKMARHPAYSVHSDKLAWYDVEWSDIVNYKDNPDREEIVYKLGNNESDRCSVTTSAQDKIEFMFEVVSTLANEKTIRYFKSTEFEEVCKKYMPSNAMLEIINELDKYKLDLKHAEEDLFADAYMDLTGRFAELEGKKGGEFHTPSDLVRACIELMPPEVKEGESIKIGDITSGACTFMIYAGKSLEKSSGLDSVTKQKQFVNNHVEFVTQEKSTFSIGLGDMNVLFHGYENHVSYCGNTITDWKGYIGDYEGKLDYIYANPPYGLKDYGFEYAKNNSNKEARWNLGVPNKSEGEYAFILSILNLLSDKGKALIVLPLGTLFKDSTKAIRQRIIENDWLEGIISLPDKMFLTTSIPVCIWIVNKNKKEEYRNKLFLIEGAGEFNKNGKFNKLNPTNIINIYNKKEIVEGLSNNLNNEDLLDYNLNINKYICKKTKQEEIDVNKLNQDIFDLIKEIYNENIDLGNI